MMHGGSTGLGTAKDDQLFPSENRYFRGIVDALVRLNEMWTLDGVEFKEKEKALLPALECVCKLLESHKAEQDLRLRAKQIKEKKERIVELCSAMQVDVDEHLEAGIEHFCVDDVNASLENTFLHLVEILAERKTKINDLLIRRQRLINEIGDAEKRKEAEIQCGEDGTFMMREAVFHPTTATIGMLQGDIDELNTLKGQRRETVSGLAHDIVAFLVNKHLVRQPIDAKCQEFCRTKDMRKLGYSSVLIKQLIERKQQLVEDEEQQQSFVDKIKKRLRLIEDRQALLAAISNVEASAGNPLRLFGDSKKLVKESAFRKTAFPRLIAIEKILVEALRSWEVTFGKRFMYKGLDYLAAIEKDVATRSIPPRFAAVDSSVGDVGGGGDSAAAKAKDHFEEILQHACDRDDPEGVEEEHNDAWAEPEEDDDFLSAREQERRKLLRLGWYPADLTHRMRQRLVKAPPKAAGERSPDANAHGSEPTPHRNMQHRGTTAYSDAATGSPCGSPRGRAGDGEDGVSEVGGQPNELVPLDYDEHRLKDPLLVTDQNILLVPPRAGLDAVEREPCRLPHEGAKPCTNRQLKTFFGGEGTAHLPSTGPGIFKGDPQLLLPTPPMIKASRVAVRKTQLANMREPRHKHECKLDVAIESKRMREALIPFGPRYVPKEKRRAPASKEGRGTLYRYVVGPDDGPAVKKTAGKRVRLAEMQAGDDVDA